MSVVLETSIGDITIDLFVEQRPRCCLNFLKLCKLKRYNFHLFHIVQRNYVAQTGKSTGSGKGNESIFKLLYGDQAAYFEGETKPRIKHDRRGLVSMVNDGNNRHGSQFFITLASDIDYLDSQNHTVFAEVAEGFEVLDNFNTVITDKDNRPYKDIRIFHTVVLDDPLPDPPGLEEFIADCSPILTKEQIDSIRIGVDEEIDDEKDMDPELLEENKKEKEAKANAQILEMMGDLPDSEVRPPDNVLFVCKLNPVTSEEDLEIIFSRFGTIISCEVIKDQKTGESLQYAFIEFENVEDCEKAYFKMDNVLIDERRIHVDFSQSVSKLKWMGKGKGVDRMIPEIKKAQFKIKNFERKTGEDYSYVFEETTGENRRQPIKDENEYNKSKHRYNNCRDNKLNKEDKQKYECDARKIDQKKEDKKKEKRYKIDEEGRQKNKQRYEKDKEQKHKNKERCESDEEQRHNKNRQRYEVDGEQRYKKNKEKYENKRHIKNHNDSDDECTSGQSDKKQSKYIENETRLKDKISQNPIYSTKSYNGSSVKKEKRKSDSESENDIQDDEKYNKNKYSDDEKYNESKYRDAEKYNKNDYRKNEYINIQKHSSEKSSDHSKQRQYDKSDNVQKDIKLYKEKSNYHSKQHRYENSDDLTKYTKLYKDDKSYDCQFKPSYNEPESNNKNLNKIKRSLIDAKFHKSYAGLSSSSDDARGEI